MFSTFEKIKELAQNKGLSLQKVAEDLGFSVNYLYTLKEKTPKSDRLQEIADYFNVSTDYLLGRTDNPRVASDINATSSDNQLAPAETQLVAAFRNQTQNMTEEDKLRFNKAIETLMVTAKTLMDDESKWR